MNLMASDFARVPGLLAQAGQQVNSTNEMVRMMGLTVIMMVAFYLLLIRPQQKKAKEHEKLLKTLRNGDIVLTSAGIVGVVLSVREKNVTLRSGESKIEFLKSSVTEVLEREDQGTEKKS